ncbi:hypothetical protein pf16_165 [Pseudomonas phage pf16]|uniref:Band 7 domain-containing protein n=1 Tax=Pseudomonas phage pf16 TaxID=1815630 RepID=A0A1S5R3V2_9CAUD|nr:hypothetical protein FDG98_gp133 [Pseudomonas phage pf16]AND75088.1 hypothetical protein pf16_165 [Pseudomonas phage pf16]
MLKKMMCVLMLAVAMVGCSKVTVPPAAKGKVLSAAGYSTDVKETGKYWLWLTEDMVILDTSTQTVAEDIQVKMKDDLTLGLKVRFRTRISGNDKVINSMFNDIKHQDYKVTLPMVYGVYGKDVVQAVSRSVLSKYEVAEVSNNYDKISQELTTELRKAMENSPLEVSNITMADLDYPKEIDDAIKKQNERKFAIQTEENEQAVKMVQKRNEMELANADYNIRIKRAETLRDENLKTAAGLNPMLLQYRQLEIMEKMANSENKVFVPYESLTNVGLQNRMYNQ